MTYRRIYAIPDIHGRLDLLDLLLQKIDDDGYNKKLDKLIFLGDYIDRGPDSKGVISLIKKLVDDGEAEAVSGNHETFALDYYLRFTGHGIWMSNGGYSTLSSYGYGPLQQMSGEHIKFLGSLPRQIVMQGFFFSHAPVPREKHRLPDKDNWRMKLGQEGAMGEPYTLWELTWYYCPPEAEGKGMMMDVHEGPLHEGEHLTGICGHIHRGPSVRDVRIYPKYRMLDCGSGCYTTGSLVAHECIENRTIYARPEDLRNMSDCICDFKPIGIPFHANPACPSGLKEKK